MRAVSHQLTLKPSRPDLRFLPCDALVAVRAELVIVDEAIREIPPGAG
jgi:hypothetical protein